MLNSVLLSVFGTIGAVCCACVAAAGLAVAPKCQVKGRNWEYHFENMPEGNSSSMVDKTIWPRCVFPENVVLWHIVLFSIALGLGLLQVVLCAIQVLNGCLDCLCGDCWDKKEDEGGL
ncbi:transmembrane 4 L6 family member 5-like [Myxocyprinus asiaticus]|uniref:transmembrane 4 L6 family member 5-like n=1 Tax=Myxocyprinus asiaticus TaxID=70543 RepID=UPI002221AB50|nr:transmembrane 4 L6 family member 5-like [Myxocyprinus asiaticus]